MPIVNHEAAKTQALQELAEEAHKKEVERQKERIKTRKQHLFSHKIVIRSPITFIEWADVPKKKKK